MPATFSINIGTPTEAYRKPTIYSVLQDIPDNTSKLISPKDVRDAIFSVWANSVFKQTSGTASIEYIGIDSNNPANRDIKQKIFIGKRNVAGTDIMSNSLLSTSNDTDIFLFNTKPDTSSQSITKISILAGTNSTLYGYAPYLMSEYISATAGDNITMDIVNPSLYGGPVNIFAQTGRVAINNIIFPSVAESSASASNGKILRYSGVYPNGSLVWSNDTVSIANIGAIGSPTTIFGSPVLINGAQIEFVDTTPIPLPVGGIDIGATFAAGSYMFGTYSQDWPVVEILRRILYPYVAPALSLSLVNNITGTVYSEVGVTASLVFSYSITRYSEDIALAQILGTTFSGITFSGSPGDILSGTLSSATFSSGNYILQVSDEPIFLGFSHSATASISFVNPTMYGFDNIVAVDIDTSTTICGDVSRIAIPSPGSQSVFLNYNGSGYLYYISPASYPLPRYIKDPNGYTVHDYTNWGSSAFTYSFLIPYVTPTGAGVGSSYSLSTNVWRTIATCSYPGGNFEFIF
jgi:hypothetical protein